MTHHWTSVMAGHSRPKDGVTSLAYVPAIHVLLHCQKDVDARHEAGHDGGGMIAEFKEYNAVGA